MLGLGVSVGLYMQSVPGWTLVGLCVFIFTLLVSLFIGVFLNSQIVLPILYSLPRSIIII